MQIITAPDGSKLAKNSEGAYVPVANIKEIDLLRDELVTELATLCRNHGQQAGTL